VDAGTDILRIDALRYRWPGADALTLDIDSMSLGAGQRLFLRGPSGSGKSTLLAAIAGAVDVAPGTVTVAGIDVGKLSGAARDRFRVDHLGIIFQQFNLLTWLSAIDNVLLPCRFSPSRRERAGPDPEASARRLLAELGLTDASLLDAQAGRLSVGQQQRVAAARALIGAPALVLADEPTSALDDAARDDFIRLLMTECETVGAALLFVSHDRDLERHFDRVLELGDLHQESAPC
jgi:putative ABC transport system ATP-binding protein